MLFKRLELWLENRFADRRAALQTSVTAGADGLTFSQANRSSSIEWQSIERIVAVKHDIYVGDMFSLYFEATDGKHFELPENSPSWEEVTSLLSSHLPDAKPKPTWMVELLASKDGRIEVYRRGSVT